MGRHALPEKKGRRPACIHLDSDLLILAREKLKETRGNDNLSDLLNEFLTDFVLGEPRGVDPIRQEVKALAERKRKEILSQRKIVQEETTIRQEVDAYQAKRDIAIRTAMIDVISSHRSFESWLPEHDIEGDFVDELDRAVDRISAKAGYDLTIAEVIKIYGDWKRQNVVSQQEHGAAPPSQLERTPGHPSVSEMNANEYHEPAA